MRYIIYSRVSTCYQDTQAQIAKCQQFVDKDQSQNGSNFEIVYFDEEDMTTLLPMKDRTKLMEMLESVRKGDVLVIYDLYRLARTDYELVYIYKVMLLNKGVRVHSILQPYINPDLVGIYASMGQMERTNVSIRTKDNLKNKQDCMEKVGTVWYGFKLDETVLQTREKTRTFGKPYKLIPEPHEYKLCLMMIEMRKQHHTYEEIAQHVNDLGYRTRNGQPWLRMTVYRIIQRANRYDPSLYPEEYQSSLQSELLCAV